MERDTHRGFKPTTIIIIAVIIIAIIVFVILWFGIDDIMKTIAIILELCVLAFAIFMLGYLFYYLFIKTQRFDVNYFNKKRLLKACSMGRYQNLKDLYLSGDKGHSRIKIGRIQGYARISVPIRQYKYTTKINPDGTKTQTPITTTNEQGEIVDQYENQIQEQDVFSIKKEGILHIFSEPDIVRVNPEDHDDLVGDVTLYGYSLIPISEYLFLNTDYLDIRKIDYAILKEAERAIAFTTLSDIKLLIDRATGIDAQHKKGIEQKSYLELPEQQRINQPPQTLYG